MAAVVDPEDVERARAALNTMIVPEQFQEFTDDDFRKLCAEGYKSVQSLQSASTTGLRAAGLIFAKVDYIIKAQGAAAGPGPGSAAAAGAAAGQGQPLQSTAGGGLMESIVKNVASSVGRMLVGWKRSGAAAEGGSSGADGGSSSDGGSGDSVGSCVVIDSRGWLLTAHHIVTEHGIKDLAALFPSGVVLTGFSLRAVAEGLDVCMLECKDVVGGDVPQPAVMGSVNRGGMVVSMSYPLVVDEHVEGVGLQQPSAFVGYLAQAGSVENVGSYYGFPNSSGGGVFNSYGELVGIHTGTISPEEMPQHPEGSDTSDQSPQQLLGNLTEASVFTEIHAAMNGLGVKATLTELSGRKRQRRPDTVVRGLAAQLQDLLISS